MSIGMQTEPFCGPLGCTGDAYAVIDHPEHGSRVGCADLVETHEVIQYV